MKKMGIEREEPKDRQTGEKREKVSHGPKKDKDVKKNQTVTRTGKNPEN